jgi:hypothetical protein
MKVKRFASTALTAIAVAVPMLAIATPAHADPDTDFQNELHIYGIYGEKDYNAWIGKIACKRLYNNLDKDANASAQFVLNQLHKDSTTAQAYQFLGAAMKTYCPDKLSVLQGAGQSPPPANDGSPAPAGPPLAAEQ